MSLRTLMERELITCTPESNIRSVAELMDLKNVGAVLVIEDGIPVGILTDRDIVIRCVVQGADCGVTTARDIMSDPVQTVSIDDGIYTVIEVMKENEIRRVAVVDEKREALGLVSFGDVFQLLGKEVAHLSASLTPEHPKLNEQAA